MKQKHTSSRRSRSPSEDRYQSSRQKSDKESSHLSRRSTSRSPENNIIIG